MDPGSLAHSFQKQEHGFCSWEFLQNPILRRRSLCHRLFGRGELVAALTAVNQVSVGLHGDSRHHLVRGVDPEHCAAMTCTGQIKLLKQVSDSLNEQLRD